MKTTIDIPDELLERAKAIALKHKVSLKILTEEGLRLVLERLSREEFVTIEPYVVTGATPPPDLSWQHMQHVLYGNEDAQMRY